MQQCRFRPRRARDPRPRSGSPRRAACSPPRRAPGLRRAGGAGGPGAPGPVRGELGPALRAGVHQARPCAPPPPPPLRRTHPPTRPPTHLPTHPPTHPTHTNLGPMTGRAVRRADRRRQPRPQQRDAALPAPQLPPPVLLPGSGASSCRPWARCWGCGTRGGQWKDTDTRSHGRSNGSVRQQLRRVVGGAEPEELWRSGGACRVWPRPPRRACRGAVSSARDEMEAASGELREQAGGVRCTVAHAFCLRNPADCEWSEGSTGLREEGGRERVGGGETQREGQRGGD